MRDEGGPLETGLGRVVIGGAVHLGAPLLIIANIPVPAVIGALIAGTAVALMLRAPASNRHRWWLRALGADLALLLALTAATLLGHLTAVVAFAWLTAYCGAFVLYGWTMEVLARSVNDRPGARRWGRTTAHVFRASSLVLATAVAALATHDLRVVHGAYRFSSPGPASLAFLGAVALLTGLVLQWGPDTLRIQRALQSHFEAEPLRRMRSALTAE
ncbi:MAG: hypothetical protein JWL83_2663 [Actinomycetia bacterium]|nr:hypothetical protein [Actinomycetes bacterium]